MPAPLLISGRFPAVDDVSSQCFSFGWIRKAIPGVWIGDFNPDSTVSVISTDTRKNAPDSLFFAFSGEKFDAHDFLTGAVRSGAKLLCVERSKASRIASAGITVPAIAVESTVAAYQALAHCHRARFPALKLFALTGSCGKTSAKEALRSILEAFHGQGNVLATEGNTNNQIGVPANLFRLNKDHRAAVIEAGTSSPGEIELLARCADPFAALIVSIAECHLEALGSLEGVANEKSHLFDFLPADGFAVIPAHDPGFEILKHAARRVRAFTFGDRGDEDCSVQYLGGGKRASSFRLTWRPAGETAVVEWSLSGAHQARNASGAAAVALAYGIPLSTVAVGLSKTALPGLRMRFTRHGSSTWINDAYNANPASMKAALRNLAEFAGTRNLVLILGDMAELGDASDHAHEEVLMTARSLFPRAVLFTVGEKMRRAADFLRIRPEETFTSARSAADALAGKIPPDSLVFLKGSRSTALEQIEPEETLETRRGK